MKLIGRRAKLTRDEECDLARRIRGGDEAARHELATFNVPLVIKVAKRYVNPSQCMDDLVQEGNVGLMKAIDYFDPRKNVRFATYAVWWIRACITRYLKDNRSQVRSGKERPVMLDFSLNVSPDEDGETTFLEQLEAPGPSPQDQYTAHERDAKVRKALARVKKRLGDLGWDILTKRLTQDEPLSLRELGDCHGLSRERVRQVELKTKSLLARYLEDVNSEGEP